MVCNDTVLVKIVTVTDMSLGTCFWQSRATSTNQREDDNNMDLQDKTPNRPYFYSGDGPQPAAMYTLEKGLTISLVKLDDITLWEVNYT